MLDEIKKALFSPSRQTLNDRLDELRNKELLIYGAGSFGKEMLSLFTSHGINISAFLDKNAEKIGSIENVPAFTLENYPYIKSGKTVIFSIVCDKDVRESIMSDIKRQGFENIIEAQSIRCLYVNFSDGYILDADTVFERIQSAYLLMSDEKSKNIFANNIFAHLTGNYSRCTQFEDNMDMQYFPEDIISSNGYDVFVDCGGFIGDTVQAVLDKKKSKKIISFEPFTDNFKMLTETCENSDSNTEFILFNSAVSNKISQYHFKRGTGSGSLSSEGDILVNTVTIDKAFMGIAPTFIKMDIEGEEINALNGAVKTIKKYTPDMAVCVYHNIDHIWEIPLLIDSINKNYSYYLRSYNAYTMETVLYAIKKEA